MRLLRLCASPQVQIKSRHTVFFIPFCTLWRRLPTDNSRDKGSSNTRGTYVSKNVLEAINLKAQQRQMTISEQRGESRAKGTKKATSPIDYRIKLLAC